MATSNVHQFNNNVKQVLRDLADSDFKSVVYTIYLALCAARNGVAVQPNKSGTGEGMKGMTQFMKGNDIPTERKGNLSKAVWIVHTLIPHAISADDADVRDIVTAFVGDRSLADLERESNEARGIIPGEKAADTLDKIIANAQTRAEALGVTVKVERFEDGTVSVTFVG